MECFHRFVKFLNDNAYCQVALTNENFCMAALNAFRLALKNSATFLITNGIGGFIRMIGRVAICLANTFFGYFLISAFPPWNEEIDNPIIILSIIMLISWALASVFMEVYSVLSLTVLQCLYADVDICI